MNCSLILTQSLFLLHCHDHLLSFYLCHTQPDSIQIFDTVRSDHLLWCSLHNDLSVFESDQPV